ncbi:MAG: prepilin-type N-terminal cleavage/methylation domain-containing protein [Planctomycetes bacterium]|nr:prepilin-type N-terminal cleavage/methylation domain-containing protein [Planctomycetota bacterium]
MARSAFTLIEMIISVALGAIIVVTAFAAFRTASLTVAAANRLALENTMLRVGVAAAHEEIDFWRDYDDPDAATRPLQAAVGGHGLPFTPFATVWPSGGGAFDSEDDQSWRPDEKAWDPSSSRTWYRGNLAERSTSKMWLGRYAIFSTAEANALSFGFNAPVSSAQSVGYSGAPAAAHHWYPFQIQRLRDALGFYGLCEYAPPNSIFATFDPRGPDTMGRNGAVLNWFVKTQSGANGFFRHEERLNRARVPPGKYRCTTKGVYAVPNPSGSGKPLSEANRYAYMVGFDAGSGNANEVSDFKNATDVAESLMRAGRPSHWPNATVSVSHFIKDARPISMCKVRVVSPVTGNAIALTFSGWGTTLRGARQQRGRNGGWVRWDNASGYVNPQTLDDP